MTAARLDRAVWDALAGPQARFAIGDDLARRFNPAVSPFGAFLPGEAGLAALGRLIGAHGPLACMQPDSVAAPPGCTVMRAAPGVQMIADDVAAPAAKADIIPLGPSDHPEMFALATLTEPGPFLARTPEMGDFFGIKAGGQLVAMAGERLRPEGYVEVSGVCTHPDHRGQGYGGLLSAFVARRILASGAMPFLHAFATNHAAIALYETLGFRVRRTVFLTVLAPAGEG